MSFCFSDSLCHLIGQKAIIHIGNCRHKVFICNITPSHVKAIEICSGNIRIFNMCHIDFIEACSC